MKAKEMIANAVAKIAKAMAVKSCGAASVWGSYQPDESKAAKILNK
ncbi:MAG: cyclic lactone autoinducer peptide [Oscillospiraceae bacterium]|nr:cyclic lactone autoinducer peptide [Oscillospiraceae bacterium]